MKELFLSLVTLLAFTVTAVAETRYGTITFTPDANGGGELEFVDDDGHDIVSFESLTSGTITLSFNGKCYRADISSGYQSSTEPFTIYVFGLDDLNEMECGL